MTFSECSEYYKKRLYHYLYIKIYSKWFVHMYIWIWIFSFQYKCSKYYIKFHSRLEMYQFKHTKPISCKKLSLPYSEDENIYSQSLGWNLVNDAFLIKLFIILVDLNIQTSQLSKPVPRQKWRHQLAHFSMPISVILWVYLTTHSIMFLQFIDWKHLLKLLCFLGIKVGHEYFFMSLTLFIKFLVNKTGLNMQCYQRHLW